MCSLGSSAAKATRSATCSPCGSTIASVAPRSTTNAVPLRGGSVVSALTTSAARPERTSPHRLRRAAGVLARLGVIAVVGQVGVDPSVQAQLTLADAGLQRLETAG